jgi:hypothetical protein
MPDDIEALQRWMHLPEVNAACFEALMQDCMSDAQQIAVMKVLNVVWREDDRE